MSAYYQANGRRVILYLYSPETKTERRRVLPRKFESNQEAIDFAKRSNIFCDDTLYTASKEYKRTHKEYFSRI